MSSHPKRSASPRRRRSCVNPDPYADPMAPASLFRDSQEESDTSAPDLYGQCLAQLERRPPRVGWHTTNNQT